MKNVSAQTEYIQKGERIFFYKSRIQKVKSEVSDGSAHLKNIETSSSSGGTVGEGGFLLRMVEITADG